MNNIRRDDRYVRLLFHIIFFYQFRVKNDTTYQEMSKHSFNRSSHYFQDIFYETSLDVDLIKIKDQFDHLKDVFESKK